RTRARRQRIVDRDFHGHGTLYRGRIGAHHVALYDRVVVQVDRRRKVGNDVFRLIFRNSQHRLELAGLDDAGEKTARVHILAKLERRIAKALELTRFGRGYAHRGDSALLLSENAAQALDLTLLKLDLLLLRRLNVIELFANDIEA